jgi:hypothetical protein
LISLLKPIKRLVQFEKLAALSLRKSFGLSHIDILLQISVQVSR